MIKFKFTILGKDWTLKLVKSKKYKKKHGSDSLAITLGWKREIAMHPKGADLETLTHELFHAYCREMCLGSTNEISQDDLEEIYAELLAKRGREILDLADNLWSQVHDSLTNNIVVHKRGKKE